MGSRQPEVSLLNRDRPKCLMGGNGNRYQKSSPSKQRNFSKTRRSPLKVPSTVKIFLRSKGPGWGSARKGTTLLTILAGVGSQGGGSRVFPKSLRVRQIGALKGPPTLVKADLSLREGFFFNGDTRLQRNLNQVCPTPHKSNPTVSVSCGKKTISQRGLKDLHPASHLGKSGPLAVEEGVHSRAKSARWGTGGRKSTRGVQSQGQTKTSTQTTLGKQQMRWARKVGGGLP